MRRDITGIGIAAAGTGGVRDTIRRRLGTDGSDWRALRDARPPRGVMRGEKRKQAGAVMVVGMSVAMLVATRETANRESKIVP